MQFTVLGPVKAWRDGIELRLGPPKQRAVLALLLAQAGRSVPAHHLVDALWGQSPPPSARNVVHRHVGALRRLLEPELASRSAARRLVRDGDGYRLDVAADELDLLRFRALREEAGTLARDAATRASAVPLFIKALSLWSGSFGAGLPPTVRAHPAIAAVDREHAEAVREAADAAVATGRAEQVLALVRHAADEEPYDEGLHARLMVVLAASGRRAEALEHYQSMRTRLSAELGVEPGPALRQAHRQVLRGLEAGAPAEDQPADQPDPHGAARTRPAQLPRDLEAFAGRQRELAGLRALLPTGGAAPGTVVISAVAGAPGVGKTTLAIHWAHQVAPLFPDGQLYVDLRGYDPSGAVVPPHEAIRGFLDALGVPSGEVPSGFDAQVGKYRSLLAERRMVVVLDNARSADQVRPLLPAAAGCLSIVTSRDQLLGLVASGGVRAWRLDALSARESLEFLARRLGRRRVAAQPEAAGALAELCGHLPLTLAVVCARAGEHPATPLADFVAELRESHGSLDAFETGDAATDARSVFSWSYRTLTPAAARMFRLLALSPAPEVSLRAAASLAGLDVRAARSALGALTRAQLWREPAPGRFAAHDLLRVYGRELALAQDSGADRAAARRRLMDHYLHTVHAAEVLLSPNRHRITLPPAAAGAEPIRFADLEQASSWLSTELPALLAVLESDAEEGDGAAAWRLASELERLLDRHGRRREQIHVQGRGLAAATRLGDATGQAHCHRALGFAHGLVEEHGQAQFHLNRAGELFAEIGDPLGEARVYRYLAYLANRRQEHREALEQYKRTAKLYADAGDRTGSAAVANEVGWTYILLGDHEGALRECRTAVRIAQETGDQNVEAGAWDSIGVAHHHLGQQDEAVDAYARALALYRDLSDAYLVADTLIHLGDAHWAAETYAAARSTWQEALTILDSLAHPDAQEARSRLRRTVPA
ncbi:MAG TPA: BTAD domain-containing putative transcriptional regulator [Actinocrinis sp.]|nr:BTAD domain-containing putative transcriptional regulator [Actinocrinis sp.]